MTTTEEKYWVCVDLLHRCVTNKNFRPPDVKWVGDYFTVTGERVVLSTDIDKEEIIRN